MSKKALPLVRMILLAAALAVAGAERAGAQPAECGDVNDSGSLTSTDALLVLKGAVGQPVDLVCDQCGSTCPGDPRYLLGQWVFESAFGEDIYQDNYDLFAVDEVNCEIVGQDLDDLGIVFAYAGADYDYVLLDPSETYCDLFLFDYVGPDQVEGSDVLLDVDVDGYCDFDSTFDEGTMIGDRVPELAEANSVSGAASPVVGPQRSKTQLLDGSPRSTSELDPKVAAAIAEVRQVYEKRRQR